MEYLAERNDDYRLLNYVWLQDGGKRAAAGYPTVHGNAEWTDGT